MEGAYLAVARFRKPHGLKGEAVLWVLTDEPDSVFVAGRTLTPIDDEGAVIGQPLTVERSRPHHRQWLVKFRGIDGRTPLESWEQVLLGVPADELTPPADGEMYAHEIPGSRVVAVGGKLVGVPGGELLAVDVDGREVLVPFRKPILVGLNRADRVIEIDAPPGLLDV